MPSCKIKSWNWAGTSLRCMRDQNHLHLYEAVVGWFGFFWFFSDHLLAAAFTKLRNLTLSKTHLTAWKWSLWLITAAIVKLGWCKELTHSSSMLSVSQLLPCTLLCPKLDCRELPGIFHGRHWHGRWHTLTTYLKGIWTYFQAWRAANQIPQWFKSVHVDWLHPSLARSWLYTFLSMKTLLRLPTGNSSFK